MRTITVALTDRQAAAIARSIEDRAQPGWHARASLDYLLAVEKIAAAVDAEEDPR